MGYSPWGPKEFDTTEQLTHTHTHTHTHTQPLMSTENCAQGIPDSDMNRRFSFVFQVQAALKRQWNQYQARRWNGRRRAHRSANAAAATAAAAAALAETPPIYICHQEPQNEPADNLGEEAAEVIPMEGGEVISMKGAEVIAVEGAEVVAMEIIEQESSA